MSVVASVVIPSYNGAPVIGQALEGILAQETDFPFEVVVADSSSDGTPDLLRSGFPQVRTVRFEQQTPAPRARNAAILQAHGEIICMVDQDCVPDPGWLQGMVQAHREHPDISVVAGGIRPANPGALWGLANFLVEFREFNHIRPAGETAHWITCNTAVKRAVFDQCGLFPEDLWPGDDVMMAHRLARAGHRGLFRPELSVAHINRAEPSRILPHARRLGQASAQVRRLVPARENSWLVRHPWCSVALPLLMPLRTLGCFLRWQPSAALKAAPLLPLMIVICAAWTRGFLEGARPQQQEVSS